MKNILIFLAFSFFANTAVALAPLQYVIAKEAGHVTITKIDDKNYKIVISQFDVNTGAAKSPIFDRVNIDEINSMTSAMQNSITALQTMKTDLLATH